MSSLSIIWTLFVVFSYPVASDSLWPHGQQHARPSCPLPYPGVCPSSCPLHQWCHWAISSSDTLFFFCPQSFPASGTFPMSQLFPSDDQNTGISTSASILPTEVVSHSFLTQGWNSGLLHCRQILYCLSHQRNPELIWQLGKPSDIIWLEFPSFYFPF